MLSPNYILDYRETIFQFRAPTLLPLSPTAEVEKRIPPQILPKD